MPPDRRGRRVPAGGGSAREALRSQGFPGRRARPQAAIRPPNPRQNPHFNQTAHQWGLRKGLGTRGKVRKRSDALGEKTTPPPFPERGAGGAAPAGGTEGVPLFWKTSEGGAGGIAAQANTDPLLKEGADQNRIIRPVPRPAPPTTSLGGAPGRPAPAKRRDAEQRRDAYSKPFSMM